MGKTKIEWCTHSLNFVKWWCTKISPGCKNCYMMTLRDRYPQHGADGPVWRDRAWKELYSFPDGAEVFVGDMYDIFHKDMPIEFIAKQIHAANVRPDCTFLYLTKRIDRAEAYFKDYSPLGISLPPNVWIGTSVESQDYIWRIDHLKRIEAKRFISFEPLLGPIDCDLTGIDGVITGAESGANRRAFRDEWVLGIRDLCARDGVAFFHKQGSAFAPGQNRVIDGRTYDALAWRKPAPPTQARLLLGD